ncbi:MAG: glycosyltransferase family 4 protein [Candidatus Omnitrophica bacterium]|nr:glycosyltransferase family 4 protein [Candidatus Omnitrophota bacterium]
MKISILTPDFSRNCFGRAWLLAEVLQRHYKVEIVGPAFGDGIWKPLSDACGFDVRMVEGYADGRFELGKMLGMISGDVIYASKPLMPSFGAALIRKISAGKPVVLDIDDLELSFGKEFYDSLIWPKKIKDFFLSITDSRAYYYTVILDRFIRFADAVTVSGKTLQRRYGGSIVYHGRDTDLLDPDKFDREGLRRKYFPHENRDRYIIAFIGTPRSHKGVEDLISAVRALDDQRILLIIVGMDEHNAYCRSLEDRSADLVRKNMVRFLPRQPFHKLPEFLSITDLVVVPQRKSPASFDQVPAKIFDAMAMAKPVIAANISDLPEILDGCGWIVEPGSLEQLAQTVKYVLNNPGEAEKKARKARQRCVEKYSWNAVEKGLIKVFEGLNKRSAENKDI